MNKPKECIYCGGGGPFTKEDLVPEWIARFLQVKKTRVTQARLGRQLDPWIAAHSFGVKVGGVCKFICNNGWMSDLEVLAKPILSKIIRPTGPVDLSPDEQLVIVCWLWKVAIAHEHVIGRNYFTADERTCLMREDAPPEIGVRVWLAGYAGDLSANVKGGTAAFSAEDGSVTEGYLLSVTIGRFAAQMLCLREIPGRSMSALANSDFSQAEVDIWPGSDERVCLPPPGGSLADQAAFDQWHLRWHRHGAGAST